MVLSVLQLADKLRTEADAYKFFEDLRWGGDPVCPHCEAHDPYFLTPKNGETRTTTRGTESPRRVWKCRKCRKQFSVLTGTIFHGTKIPVRTWIFVVFEMASSKNGISAREIERKYDLTAKSAWRMTQRVREAMKRDPMAGLMTGHFVLDEIYISSRPSNRHGFKPGRPGVHDKVAVMALVSRETGEVVTKVVPNVTGGNLAAAMRGEVDPERVVLHTDKGKHYTVLGRSFQGQETVDHGQRGDVTTSHAEGFFSQLKRSIDGRHHHVSVDHLHRYLAEFAFGYTYRKESDAERMTRLVESTAGRRLRYSAAS